VRAIPFVLPALQSTHVNFLFFSSDNSEQLPRKCWSNMMVAHVYIFKKVSPILDETSVCIPNRECKNCGVFIAASPKAITEHGWKCFESFNTSEIQCVHMRRRVVFNKLMCNICCHLQKKRTERRSQQTLAKHMRNMPDERAKEPYCCHAC